MRRHIILLSLLCPPLLGCASPEEPRWLADAPKAVQENTVVSSVLANVGNDEPVHAAAHDHGAHSGHR